MVQKAKWEGPIQKLEANVTVLNVGIVAILESPQWQLPQLNVLLKAIGFGIPITGIHNPLIPVNGNLNDTAPDVLLLFKYPGGRVGHLNLMFLILLSHLSVLLLMMMHMFFHLLVLYVLTLLDVERNLNMEE